MKKNLRGILMILLISVSVIGNIIFAVKIQKLENKLAEEKNPTFEQAKQKVSTQIAFSGDLSERQVVPEIEYWPTGKEAREHLYKVCSAGKFSALTDIGVNNNFYMVLQKDSNFIDSRFSHLGEGDFYFQAPLSEAGTYLLAVNYRGVTLWFAFEVDEVEKK